MDEEIKEVEAVEEVEEKKILKPIYKLCWRCKGAKKYILPLGDVPCEYCNETGIELWGYMEK